MPAIELSTATELVDQIEQRILSSQPDSQLHDSETCPLCSIETMASYGLDQAIVERTRRILVRLDRQTERSIRRRPGTSQASHRSTSRSL